jgi:hypothetical protein
VLALHALLMLPPLLVLVLALLLVLLLLARVLMRVLVRVLVSQLAVCHVSILSMLLQDPVA